MSTISLPLSLHFCWEYRLCHLAYSRSRTHLKLPSAANRFEKQSWTAWLPHRQSCYWEQISQWAGGLQGYV